MKTSFAAAALCALLSLPAAADPLELRAAESASRPLATHLLEIRAATQVEVVVNVVGTGQSMLDLIDGKSAVAVVATDSLWDAVAAARVAAWNEGKRLLVVRPTLAFHTISAADDANGPLAFVTNAPPSPQLAKVMDYLRSESGRKLLVQR
jgi:hypothetical protein